MVLFKVLHLSPLCNEFCHSQLCSWALSSGREFAFWLQKGTVSSYYNGKPISMWNFKALISLVSPSEAACRSHCHHLTVRAQGWAALPEEKFREVGINPVSSLRSSWEGIELCCHVQVVPCAGCAGALGAGWRKRVAGGDQACQLKSLSISSPSWASLSHPETCQQFSVWDSGRAGERLAELLQVKHLHTFRGFDSKVLKED